MPRELAGDVSYWIAARLAATDQGVSAMARWVVPGPTPGTTVGLAYRWIPGRDTVRVTVDHRTGTYRIEWMEFGESYSLTAGELGITVVYLYHVYLFMLISGVVEVTYATSTGLFEPIAKCIPVIQKSITQFEQDEILLLEQ